MARKRTTPAPARTHREVHDRQLRAAEAFWGDAWTEPTPCPHDHGIQGPVVCKCSGSCALTGRSLGARDRGA